MNVLKYYNNICGVGYNDDNLLKYPFNFIK